MDLGYFEKSRIWFTADIHAYHNNIIKYCNRPFDDTEEMHEAIISNWNTFVGKTDMVFIAGDLGFFKKKEQLIDFMQKLNGYKIVTPGNHDYQFKIQRWTDVFTGVYDNIHFRVKDDELEEGKMRIFISHFPHAHWFRGYIHLHGHLHTGPYGTGDEVVDFNPLRYDIGMDNNLYKPISYEELKVIITQQKVYGLRKN